MLAAELLEAGFEDTRSASLAHAFSISRDEALARIRGRHISTFQLLSEDEYAAGLARAERELPERVDFTQHWLVLSAGA